MQYMGRLILLASICVFGTAHHCMAGTHTVSTSIELSATAINRYLNDQYNSLNFPRSVSFVYAGTNYTLALTLPEVIFTQNNAKIRMTFDVNTATTNVYHFEVDPSINIPSGQINLAQVQAFLTDLPTQLNAISIIPQWVRDNVVLYYNSLGITMYPSRLIDQVNSTWLAQHGIEVTSPFFTLGWQVSPNILTLVISTQLDAHPPSFGASLLNPSTGNDQAYFLPTHIDATIKEVIVAKINGDVLADVSPNTACPRAVATGVDIGLLNLNTIDTYVVKAIFVIDNTWYAAMYNVPVNAVDANGYLIFVDASDKENF